MMLADDREFIRREPQITGLALLFDTSDLAGLLPASFAVDADSIQPYYVRYKPGTSCLMGYRARTNGEESYFYATAFAETGEDKLRALEREIQHRQKQPVASLPAGKVDWQNWIGIRPLAADRKLAVLPKFLTKRGQSHILQRIFPHDPPRRQVSHTLLNYKPERRLVAKVQADGRALLLKAYAPNEYASVSRPAKHLPEPQTLQIQPRLGKSSTFHVQMFSWLEGTSLDRRLLGGQAENSIILADVAAALAELHQAALPGEKWEVDDSQWQRVVAARGAILALAPDMKSTVDWLLAAIHTELKVTPSHPCPVHNDCSADQFLRLVDGRLALLDWDRAALGDPMTDLASFVANLYLAGRVQDGSVRVDHWPQRSPALETHALLDNGLIPEPARCIDQEMQQLIASYAGAAPHLYGAPRFRAHLVARLLRLAPESFRRRRPDWAAHLHALIGFAQEVVNHDL
jgi:hypothetical protein